MMSFFNREQRYEMLCAIKRGSWWNGQDLTDFQRELTAEEEAFVVEFATEKFNEIMRDLEVVAVMQRLKDR
jgi:hypothetical protein